MSAKLNSYVSLHGFTAADKRSCVLWVKHVNGRIKEKDRRDDLRVVCSSDTYSSSSEASSWVSGRTERAGTLRPGRSGRRQLRSLARDRTLRHAHPGNLGAGSRRRAVINQGPERRQVNGRGGERTKVMGRDTEERDRESGGGREGELRFYSPNHIHLLPNPLFFPSLSNLFILGLFLLCELFTHSVMDD